MSNNFEYLPLIKYFDYFNYIGGCISERKPFPFTKIHLAGGRKSGKSFSIYIFLSYVFITLGAKIRIYCFRKYSKDLQYTIIEEFLEALGRLNFTNYKPQITHKTWLARGNKISFHSLHKEYNDKISLTGLSSSRTYDYVIVHFEEMFEYDSKDIEAVKQAIRGAKNVMYIESCNPWKIHNKYIWSLHEKFPFNLETLKEKGEQIKLIDKELYHYTNYKINYELPLSDIQQLQDFEKEYPIEANVVCYGFPADTAGSVYGYALRFVKRELAQKHYQFITAGLDYGYRVDAMALVIVGVNENYNNVEVIKEYFYSNKDNVFRNHGEHAEYICRMLIDTLEEHPYLKVDNNGLNEAEGITIYCDYSNEGFITILNNHINELNYADFIEFTTCDKLRVRARVSLQLNLMESGKLRVSNQCPNFYRELELAEWDEKKQGEEVKDINNHTQDAFHYGLITPYWNNFKNIINPLLFKNNLK